MKMNVYKVNQGIDWWVVASSHADAIQRLDRIGGIVHDEALEIAPLDGNTELNIIDNEGDFGGYCKMTAEAYAKKHPEGGGILFSEW